MKCTDPNLVFRFDAYEQSFRIEDHCGYMTRNRNTVRLLSDAMTRMKEKGVRLRSDMVVPIYTGDRAPASGDSHCFAYAGDGSESHVLRIPDFAFGGWPDYEATARAMIEAGRREPEDHRLFWIGNVATHSSRKRLVAEFGERNSRVCARNLIWVRQTAKPGLMHDVPQGSQLVSLPEHCRYRYLLDMQGAGYSARLKMLQFSGRPVFIQDRKWTEYWHAFLRPLTHFVPVREDLADLSERLDWADKHSLEVRQISQNAQNFALEHLLYKHAVERTVECMRIAESWLSQSR